MASYFFNIAKGGFLNGGIPAWNSAGGGTADFLAIFVGGGSSNGLGAAGAEDADTLSDIAGIATYQFNGSGYTANGIALGTRTVTIDDTNDRAVFDAADIAIGALGAGTSNGTQITHIVLAYENATATFGDYVPIACIDLGATYTGNGGPFTVEWNTLGLFTLS